MHASVEHWGECSSWFCVMNMRSVWFSLYISRRKELIDIVLDPGERLLIFELNSQSNSSPPLCAAEATLMIGCNSV